MILVSLSEARQADSSFIHSSVEGMSTSIVVELFSWLVKVQNQLLESYCKVIRLNSQYTEFGS